MVCNSKNYAMQIYVKLQVTLALSLHSPEIAKFRMKRLRAVRIIGFLTTAIATNMLPTVPNIIIPKYILISA